MDSSIREMPRASFMLTTSNSANKTRWLPWLPDGGYQRFRVQGGFQMATKVLKWLPDGFHGYQKATRSSSKM
jgi:hypothetical protein